jgi:hypothetical protein
MNVPWKVIGGVEDVHFRLITDTRYDWLLELYESNESKG